MTGLIYKVCTAPEWAAAEQNGAYAGSEHDIRDGFIHLSTWQQLPGTIKKHFSGKPDLLLIAVDESLVGEILRYEPSRGGDLFPHIYGHLPLDSVMWVKPLDEVQIS